MIGKQPTQEPDTYGVDDGDGECQTTTGNYVLNLFSHLLPLRSSLFTLHSSLFTLHSLKVRSDVTTEVFVGKMNLLGLFE